MTIEIVAAKLESVRYEDHDDCLSAAIADVAEDLGVEPRELSADWDDERSREMIIVRAESWPLTARLVEELTGTVRDCQERSRLRGEMVEETAQDDESREAFAAANAEIAGGYDAALEYIAAGDWSNAIDTLVGVADIEDDGGDDQHARAAITAIESVRP